MSPTQLILHMALAEELSLKRMARRPPSELKQAQPKPTFLFRKVVATMQAAKESPGPPSTMPKKPINLEEAEAKWQEVRSQLRSRFAEAETPASVIQKGFPFGALSAADLFTLFESHAHYHTVRFPKI